MIETVYIFYIIQTVVVKSHFVLVQVVVYPCSASEDPDVLAIEVSHQKSFPQVLEKSQSPWVITK